MGAETDVMRRLKRLARAVSPPPVRAAWGRVYGGLKVRRARQVFERNVAGAAHAFLSSDVLSMLMRDGYRPPDVIRYDADGLVQRADEKIERLAGFVDLSLVHRALELGCWDGMVGARLAQRGIRISGLDIVTRGFDDRAAHAGVQFVQGDAEVIPFRDESIDLVYSFASFEHFPHPDRCMHEVDRVLRQDAQVYLDFGPLYFSPYGRHAYRQIPIPFCHLLFEEQELHRWAGAHDLPHDWPFVNGWSFWQYQDLWQSLASRFAIVGYREHRTGGVGTELIARYPQCFRDVDHFDELLVAHVEIALRKR